MISCGLGGNYLNLVKLSSFSLFFLNRRLHGCNLLFYHISSCYNAHLRQEELL
jgi:hypothetical protein